MRGDDTLSVAGPKRVMMVKTYSGTSDEIVYVCQECGDGFTALDTTGKCPECGGSLKDTSLPHN